MKRKVDDTEEHYREVYAQFGLVAYYGQSLERNLMILLTLSSALKIPGATVDIYDQLLEKHSKKTLGWLLKKLGNHIELPPELGARLPEALSKRNFLVHHFFYERAERFCAPEGRDSMIEELVAARELLATADKSLDPLVDGLHAKIGMSTTKLRKIAIEMFGEEVGGDLF